VAHTIDVIDEIGEMRMPSPSLRERLGPFSKIPSKEDHKGMSNIDSIQRAGDGR
jgi:hypothetical protein